MTDNAKSGKTTGLFAHPAFPVLCLLACLVVVCCFAWMCDDAYITLRTVDNFTNGHGLTWNTGERVQAYTHPLWMFLLSIPYSLTGEAFYTTLIVSIAASFAAFCILLLKTSVSNARGLLCALLLLFSRGFIDYTTSGLENPLSFLLCALFFLVAVSHDRGGKQCLVMTLLFSLVLLNRLDLSLVVFPPLAWVFLREMKTKRLSLVRAVIVFALGLLPFIAWELFSVAYYGFPFPNTAYAKLNTGISALAYITQSLDYYRFTFLTDPVSLLVILLGLVFATRGSGIVRAFGLGIALYLLYVLKIGGCFMAGRFFAVPVFMSVLLLSRADMGKLASRAIPALAVVMCLVSLVVRARETPQSMTQLGYKTGIVYERDVYGPHTGLLVSLHSGGMKHPWLLEGQKTRNSINTMSSPVMVRGVIGFFGYAAGPDAHIVDVYALSDPLLARLPCTKNLWRIGHFRRQLPDGYLSTLRTGTNMIENPALGGLYDRLLLVTQGPVFNHRRIKEIVRFNLGRHDHLAKIGFVPAARCHHQVGRRRTTDPPAEESVLVADVSDPKGFLAFGRTVSLPAGSYVADFVVSASDGKNSRDGARLDVATSEGRNVLGMTSVSAQSSWEIMGGKWKAPAVPFEITGPGFRRVEPRVYYMGNGSVTFHSVTIRPSEGGQ